MAPLPPKISHLRMPAVTQAELAIFTKAHSSLSQNCSLLGTDNVRGQISEHIFWPNAWRLLSLYIAILKETRINRKGYQKNFKGRIVNVLYSHHKVSSLKFDIDSQDAIRPKTASFGKSNLTNPVRDIMVPLRPKISRLRMPAVTQAELPQDARYSMMVSVNA